MPTDTLVIVESPAKARTIKRFLGDNFQVESSIGHIRDLPANADEVPAEWKEKDREAGRLGIEINQDFSPIYVIPSDKKKHVRDLKKIASKVKTLYLATDEDREGEAIAWHLLEVLQPKAEVKRLVFHEITKTAIERALGETREIHTDLVEAQETRRLVDRLYGYLLSPLLWKKIRPRLSAGRVQSVAVRLVVERERERIAFRSANYWDLLGTFQADKPELFEARLVEVAGQRLAIGKDFDQATGQLTENAKAPRLHLTEEKALALAARLEGLPATVFSVERKPTTEKPSPPFTTSTLQQAAGRRLGFTAKRAMRAAQRLYQNGYITYMRTDSVTLSEEALTAARDIIQENFGAENLPDEPKTYKTKVKNAQEAHEAIRPAGRKFRHFSDLESDLGEDEKRLYEMIWCRTVACQMKDAKGFRTTLQIDVDDARFQVSGKIIDFPGFRLAWGAAEKTEEDEKTRLLPNVQEGDSLENKNIVAEGHQTKPPARLTEATLVKELEARGIGRPSTYAEIIEKIQARDYCFKKGSALVPTITSFAVTELLSQHMEHLIDYEFTARMENDLDEISNGRLDRLSYLQTFYRGNGKSGLKQLVDEGEETIDPRQICSVQGFALGEFENVPIELRVGRYGPFLSAGEITASLVEDLPPDELTAEIAADLLTRSKEGETPLCIDPETQLPVYVKTGRFGPYVQMGDPEELGGEKPKTSSLLPGMDAATLTPDQAFSLLTLPRTLGTVGTPDTEDAKGTDEDVLALNGRYGPYLKWGKETRSLPEGEDILAIGLEKALEILRKPKERRGRSSSRVLKELGPHPETEDAILVKDGRYGPYVTDGSLNATLPKETSPEKIDMDLALELLAARAARVGSRKGKRKKAKAKAKPKAKSRDDVIREKLKTYEAKLKQAEGKIPEWEEKVQLAKTSELDDEGKKLQHNTKMLKGWRTKRNNARLNLKKWNKELAQLEAAESPVETPAEEPAPEPRADESA